MSDTLHVLIQQRPMKAISKRNRKGKVDPAIFADVVKRVVKAAQPEKIVLFGSAARGMMGPDSLVICPACGKARSCMKRKRYPPNDPREWI